MLLLVGCGDKLNLPAYEVQLGRPVYGQVFAQCSDGAD